MNVLTNTPDNVNQLNQLNSRMLITQYPTVSYFCYAVNLPGLTLPSAEQPTAFVTIPQPGDHLQFEPLVATFKVDENLKNFFEIHSWMRNLSRADDFREYKNLQQTKGPKSNILVAYLDSSRNPNIMVTYYDAFPVQLTGIQFNSQTPDVTTASSSVVFRYTNYDYEFLKEGKTFPENFLTEVN